MYKELGEKERSTQVPPNAAEAKELWSKLWNNPVPYKEDGEWLNEVELELESCNIQHNVEITEEDVKMKPRKMPKWKEPRSKEIQGFWLKRFISQHQR